MRLSFRTIFYTIVALTALTLGVVGATGYFRGFDVPNTLLNSRLTQLIASRYGFHYQLDNLRFGCLQQSCPGDISFGALDLIIATPEIFRVHLNGTEWNRRTPITARNLEIRSGTRPPLISVNNIQVDPRSSRTTVNGARIQLMADDPASDIGRVEFDNTAQRVMAAGIQLRMKDRPPVGLEQAAVQGWQRSAADGWVVLDDVTARGLKLAIDQTRNSLSLCAPLPASDRLQRAVEPLRPILPVVRESFSKLRTDLLRLAIVAGILFFVFKLLSVLWVKRWVVRLAVSTIPAAAPFIIYFVWRNALSTRTLVLAEGGEVVLAVVLFFIFVYRWRTKWYQLWEPLVLDFASVFIMLPLLASGYELPSLPAAPAGIRVGRLDVADIDGQSNNGIQFQIPQTSIRNARLALPASGKGVLRLDVSSGEVAKARISVPPSSSISADNLRIDDITGEYDPKQREVRSISARIRLNGSVESDAVQRQLRSVEFLRGFNSRPNRLTFDLDLRASGTDVQPVVSDQFQAGEHLVAVNAAVALQLRDCTARYAVATRIRTEPLILTAQIDGDTQRVNIRTIRTLPGSPIQIGGGSGTITLNTGTADINLGLKNIGGTFGSNSVSVEAVSFSTSSRGIGGLAPQTAQISLGGTTIHASREWEAQVAKASVTVARRPNHASVPVAVQSRFDDVRIKRPGEGAIEADWPVLETSISGQTTPELIPHHFSGTIRFQGSEGTATRDVFGTDRHLLINADIWKGLLNIPQQDLVLRGPIISGRSVEVPLRFELAGRLISVYPRLTTTLETEAAVSHFEQTLGSSTLAFSDARFTGRLDVNDTGASGSLKYGTGWNSVELQSEPLAFCLDEISRFDVAATGHIAKLSPALPLLSLDPSTATSCLSIPSLPNKLRFRISGVFPPGPQTYAIQVERENGDGIRIRDIEANIQTLQIQGGRLEDMHTGVKLAGIQNLQGGGGLDVRTDVEQVGDGLQIRSTLLDSEGTPLLDAELSGTENRFTLDAKQHVPADQLIRRFQSFIPSLASSLNGIHPKGRITTVHAEANFDRGTFVEASAVGQFASGAILSTDSPGRRLDISTKNENAGPAFHLDIGRRSETDGVHPVVAGIDLRDASVRLVTDRNGESQTSLSLGLETRGSLFRRVTPPIRPVLKTVVQVGSGLSRQVSNIADLVRDQNTSESLSNLDWNLRLTQTSPAKPLVRMETDAVQLGMDVASFGASWDSAGQDRSRVAGSVRLDATVSESDSQLILDSLAPITFSYSRGGDPETRIESTLPVQVAFAERLSEAQDKTRTLWNEDYYSQFWRDHPSRFSPTALVSPIDSPEVTFGPVFLRQIQFPDRPLQVSIGYSPGLQVRLPISGRALFGNVEGRLETSLTPSPVATLDTRLTLDLKGIQADALQTIRAGFHSAILEDELDGNFSLTLDGLTMDREALSAARAGQFNSDELRKIGLSVHMLRTRDGARWPGVFQSSSNLEINLLNEVLNRIAKDLRLSAPPRALTYRNLNLDVDVDHGRVQTDRDILRLGGLQLFSSDFIDVTGDIRAHAGSVGERVMLSDLIEMLRGFSSTEPDRP